MLIVVSIWSCSSTLTLFLLEEWLLYDRKTQSPDRLFELQDSQVLPGKESTPLLPLINGVPFYKNNNVIPPSDTPKPNCE